jgi:hypothetical protein
MRTVAAVCVLLLMGCSVETPVAPESERLARRAAEIEAILLQIVSSQSKNYETACYPSRPFLIYDASHLSDMALEAAGNEMNGYNITCVSIGGKGDTFGAVHPTRRMVFQCPIGEGLVITMQRGSIADGTAECMVVQ